MTTKGDIRRTLHIAQSQVMQGAGIAAVDSIAHALVLLDQLEASASDHDLEVIRSMTNPSDDNGAVWFE